VSEETTASAADLLAQSDELIAALSEFRIEGGERSTAKRGGGASGADTGSESSIVAVKPRVADWQAAADAAARAPRAQPSEPAGAAASSAARVAPAGSAAPAAVAKGGSWHEF
jgi:hypothetical protein